MDYAATARAADRPPPPDLRGEPLAVPHSAGTAAPQAAAPAGAVDCHMHIFDPRFPFIPGRNPGVATLADYRLLQRRLGLSRCIVVAASSHGMDNRCLLEALKQFGDAARGVASAGRDTTDAELEHLHAQGVRGIRMNYGRSNVVAGDLRAMADRIAPLKWHLQINMHADAIVEHRQLLQALPLTTVFDHLGRPPQPGGLQHPAVQTLAAMLATGRTYIKLSHYYESPGVSHADYRPLVEHLIDIAPERLLWGSDWPHATQTLKPDDAVAFDQLAHWARDEGIRRRILVDNPQALYWGDAPASGRTAS